MANSITPKILVTHCSPLGAWTIGCNSACHDICNYAPVPSLVYMAYSLSDAMTRAASLFKCINAEGQCEIEVDLGDNGNITFTELDDSAMIELILMYG